MPLTPVGSLWRVGRVDLLGDVIHLALRNAPKVCQPQSMDPIDFWRLTSKLVC